MRTSTNTIRGVVLAALVAVLLSACGDPERGSVAGSAFDHVHGLGIDPQDGRLRIATHDGLFVLKDGEPERVGSARHDLMGFTVVGPRSYLASGHPSSTDLPEPMGLVRSDDAGVTWRQVSLGGRADLHSLDTSTDILTAHDSSTGNVLLSPDRGKTFTTLATIDAFDTAQLEARKVMVAGRDGTLSLIGADGIEKLPGAPVLVTIDRTPEGVAALGPDGRSWSSPDGRTWTARGQLEGVPAALEAGGATWYAATSTGIYASSDQGASWARRA